jgi:cobalt/nickel transport system permease protein
MHIPEGALGSSAAGMAVLGAGVLAAGVGTALGLGRMDYQRVPRVAMLSAAFFVASLLSVPVGPTYIHPLLNGLMGLVLGWAAFPALLVALLLQAVFFQYGGLTTLGLNTVNMALPAVACYYLFGWAVRARNDATAALAAAAAGATGVALAAGLMAGSLIAAHSVYKLLGGVIFLSDLVAAGVEALVTVSVVLFLRKVRPELLQPLEQPVEHAELYHA